MRLRALLSLVITTFVAAPCAHAVEINEVLPSVTLQDANGNPVSLPALKGKVTLVDFWASWCPPCQESLPWMKTLVDRYEEQGLKIVAISVDREHALAEKTLKRVKPNYPVLFDPKGVAAQSFGVPTMPTSYLIDAQGRVRIVHRGFKGSDKEAVEREIEKLLGE